MLKLLREKKKSEKLAEKKLSKLREAPARGEYMDTSNFSSVGEGSKRLQDDFNAWSEMLTTRSIELSFAIIAANWAVHGNENNILNNFFAKWSILIIFVFLGVNLMFTWLLSERLFARHDYAEKNHESWKKEFENYKKEKNPIWPYTHFIEGSPKYLRHLKFLLPLLSASFFIKSLFP